jgi:hypothetical protein
VEERYHRDSMAKQGCQGNHFNLAFPAYNARGHMQAPASNSVLTEKGGTKDVIDPELCDRYYLSDLQVSMHLFLFSFHGSYWRQ